MAGVNGVEDRLADKVVRDGVDLQVVLLEQLPLAGAVGVVRESLVDFEVVAPASQFEPVVTKVAGLLAEIFQLEIGPLAGEQRNRTSHRENPFTRQKQRHGRKTERCPQEVRSAHRNVPAS